MDNLEPCNRASPSHSSEPSRINSACPNCSKAGSKRAGKAVAVLACGTIGWCVTGLLPCSAESLPLRTGDQFVRRALPSTSYLSDIGVADVNDDGWLDIYTTNHQVRPLILVNERGGDFSNDVLPLGLGTAEDYAGGEPTCDRSGPAPDRAGLYIYWHCGELIVRAHRIPASTPASGAILVNRSEVSESHGPAVIAERPPDAAVQAGFAAEKAIAFEKTVTFSMQESSTVLIKSFREYYYAPRFKISDRLPLDAIFIGTQRANPASHSFMLAQSDRHGMAWFDVDHDGATDVVIANGGQGGQMRGRVEEGSGSYKVLLKRAGRFDEIFPYEELSRYGCPTRQLSTVDYDGDGDLDIYVVCGRGSQQAHQLFERAAEFTFSEMGAVKGLDAKDDGLSTWFDADGDGDMDLFWTTKREAWLYRNNDGRFHAEAMGTLRDRARQIAKADYDGDGDLDLYLAAPNGSSLLIGEQGTFEIVEPERLGLPQEAVCGTWVDYNNDGFQDLHALPGGIYEQRADQKFYPTGLLGMAEAPSSAFCTWFDADNDGYRDLLVALPQKTSMLERLRARIARRTDLDTQVRIAENRYLFFLQGVTTGHPFFKPQLWDLNLYRAIAGDRHWLEVELAGARGNRPAIGAAVRVRTASAVQIQAVGHAEGSLRSSGHYRVYFGLGEKARIDSVQLTWPDGSVQELDRVASDRLLTVQQETEK